MIIVVILLLSGCPASDPAPQETGVPPTELVFSETGGQPTP